MPDISPNDVFAEFVARYEKDPLTDFEAVLRGHPESAARLKALHAAWEANRPGQPAGADEPRTESGSLVERLRERFGDDLNPTVTLHSSDDSTEEFSVEVMKRLSDRTSTASRYRIKGEIARGGMGAILKIWDEDLRRNLAMKVILGQADAPARTKAEPGQGVSDTPLVTTQKVARFLEEAQVTAQLDHPGVVPVHELGLDASGRVYFTMKLVKGQSLKEVFDLTAAGKEGWTQTKALGVLLKVCEAMAYAHDKKVIHRDLKPANVMVGKFGEVHVMDWGLARIIGQADPKDIRIRDDIPKSSVVLRTEREDHRNSAPESPLCTMDGDVVGTPAYMPFEQAAGNVNEVGPHSDVYALGAMLYHLLAGHMPYLPRGARLNSYAIWALVQQGPPTPITQLAPHTPSELIAICEKAMARDWRARYRDMSALAADLSAYLEHRVVAAYETGAWAETKKWVERNKPLAVALAATVLALVAGLFVTLSLRRKADANAELAETRRIAAEQNEIAAKSSETRAIAGETDAKRQGAIAHENEIEAKRQEKIAKGTLEDVLSLSAIQDLTDLEVEADRLWPAEPSNLAAYDAWLERAHLLIEGRSGDSSRGIERKSGLADHRAKLRDIQQRAKERTAAQVEADRRASPKFAEYERTCAGLTWMARMMGADPGPSEAQIEAQLVSVGIPTDADALNTLAWAMVDPDSKNLVYGDEVKALVYARRAVSAASSETRPAMLDTLAWALFRNGRFDEALAAERRSVEEDKVTSKADLESAREKLEASIAKWHEPAEDSRRITRRNELSKLKGELEIEINARRTFEFEDGRDRWWNAQLTKLVDGIEAFQDPTTGLLSSGISPVHSWGIVRRRDLAATIADMSTTGAEAIRRWDEAIDAIARSERYRLTTWPSGQRLAPQLGLLPIGPDPVSGLWEFCHLASAQDFQPTVRDTHHKLVLDEGTGIVLVLVPGGTFTMGAQATDPKAKNYDPNAGRDERPHEVTLDPYFISKFEMTQGQWSRAMGRNPSYYAPTNYLRSWNRGGAAGSLLHPVEEVSWNDCTETCMRLGLVLPTEARWEHACRAGTSTPYWSGSKDDSLAAVGNVADAWAKSHDGSLWLGHETWDDGNTVTAAVGSYAANPYGLHDVHGNVFEWCSDPYVAYEMPGAKGDGALPSAGAMFHLYRGGSFTYMASFARSAARVNKPPKFQFNNLGLRPARSVNR